MSNPDAADNSGIPHAAELVALVDATIKGTDEEVTAARDALLKAAGPEAVVDAAAVIGNFEKMNRIADAAGIELDPPVRTFSAELREDLGINEYAAAALTKPTGFGAKLMTKLMWPVMKIKYTRGGAKN